MTADAAPEIIVESSGLFPPLSGVGYYARELLRAYAALPGHFPLRLLAPRFILRRGPAPGEDYLSELIGDLAGTLEVRRRLVPAAVYAGFRRFGRRPPVPLDLLSPPRNSLYFFPNYVGEPLLRRRCIPVIYDFGFLRHPRSLRGRDDLYLRRYLPPTLKHALHTVVISDCVRRELETAYAVPSERITTVFPAVDHARFRPDISAEARKAVRKRYGLDSGYVFSLGTIEPRKNFARLIEAFALLSAGLRDHLTLAIGGGPGWKSEDVPAAIRRLEVPSRVKLLGYIRDEDRAPLMADAACFALPSLYEGFGLPVLEAMACGTPVVISAGGALAEVAAGAAVTVDPLRPESIAAGMLSVLKHAGERKKRSALGLRRAADFHWEASARALAGVFKKAAAEAGLGPDR